MLHNKPVILFDSEHTDPNMMYYEDISNTSKRNLQEGFWDDVKPAEPVAQPQPTQPAHSQEWTTEKNKAVESLKTAIEKMKPHMEIFFNHHDPQDHDDILFHYNKLHAAVYKEWQKDKPIKASPWEEGEGGPDWS
jgi:hypothetical protein